MEEHKRLKPNDAKMAAFLEFGCAAGLLIDLSTDINELRKQISIEIHRNRIRFPYIFGRELHDRAVELFPERTKLTNEQTIHLLDSLPKGVFQAGHTVVGPYGCTYSDAVRFAEPSRAVPGYLCSDETCQTIHSIRLNTAESSVDKARHRVRDYIERHYSKTADDHHAVIREALMAEYLREAQFRSDNLIDVLSDGLSEGELRAVIDRLLRTTFKTEGRRLDIAKRLEAAVVNPTEFVAGIERPHLIQIALLHSDSQISRAIEESLQAGSLKLRDFEVRVCRVRRWDPSAHLPSAEIGPLGVRFTASSTSRFVAERLLRLLQRIYLESDFWDIADLAYVLEAANSLSDGELLDQTIWKYSPRKLFTELILPNRRAAILAAEELEIWGHDRLSREELLSRFLWKIGEPATNTFTELRRIEEYAAKLDDANNAGERADSLRSYSSPLFAAVEDSLGRALIFCTWLLTTDHYLMKEGFQYDPLTNSSVIEFIEAHAPTDDSELKLKVDGQSTLVALSSGSARLAKALRKMEPQDFERPTHQIPPRSLALSRPFAFPYTLPFLNLSEPSKAGVLTALQSVSRLMQSEEVVELRNSTSHGNRPFPGPAQINSALQHVQSLLDHLRSTGLYPRLFELAQVTQDGLGREQLTYEAPERPEVAIILRRPQWAIAPRFPIRQARLIIVPVAKTIASGPLRFRLKSRPGKDPYWEGWPKRWHIRTDYSEVERTIPAQEDMGESA